MYRIIYFLFACWFAFSNSTFVQRATWNDITNVLPEKSSHGLFRFPWANPSGFNYGVAYGTSASSSDPNIFYFFSHEVVRTTEFSSIIAPDKFPLPSVRFMGALYSNITPSRSTPFFADQTLTYRTKGVSSLKPLLGVSIYLSLGATTNEIYSVNCTSSRCLLIYGGINEFGVVSNTSTFFSIDFSAGGKID